MAIRIPVVVGVPSTQKKLVVCSECSGEGAFSETSFPDTDVTNTKTCPVCLGTRLLCEIKTVTYQRLNSAENEN